MPIDEFLIDAQPGEIRIAGMEGDRLVELDIARPDMEGVSGTIYLGRVTAVAAGIQAAFVDIGLARAGFLGLAEARPAGLEGGRDVITDYASEGDAIVVQATHDPQGDKGAKLTTRLSIPGNTLIHTPDEPGVRVSRRIAGPDRERLLRLLHELAESDGGFIARTAAVGKSEHELRSEAGRLRARLGQLRELAARSRPPARLLGELDAVRRVLRDVNPEPVRRVVVSDGLLLAELREFCAASAPTLVDRLEPHRERGLLFELRGVEDQIALALASEVPLAGGGRILFGETPALTAIDVDTGARDEGGKEETALRTNLAAAAEIARQVRLRNLAGLLVVDVVAMRRKPNQAQVLSAFRAAFRGDPRQAQVVGYSRHGLLEITRRRLREPLARILQETCPTCGGSGRVAGPATVAFEALRVVAREASAQPGVRLALAAHPAVIDTLHGPARGALQEVEARLGRALVLHSRRDMARDHFQVSPAGDGDGDRHHG